MGLGLHAYHYLSARVCRALLAVALQGSGLLSPHKISLENGRISVSPQALATASAALPTRLVDKTDATRSKVLQLNILC